MKPFASSDDVKWNFILDINLKRGFIVIVNRFSDNAAVWIHEIIGITIYFFPFAFPTHLTKIGSKIMVFIVEEG